MQAPLASTAPHSYCGQHVVGSVPTTFAQAHLIAGQTLVAPVDVAARGSQTGQVYVWQHVIGSTPFGIGVTPFGQTGANVGQATGLFGSHFGCSGTHLPTHCWPLQFPLASHTHDGSEAGQAHVESGGTLVPVAGSIVVVGVPPVAQPQPEQLTSHACPVGQSVLARQPLWMLGTQMP
jgi:hypothetical protein